MRLQAGFFDFESVVAHEIGHALGSFSGVDVAVLNIPDAARRLSFRAGRRSRSGERDRVLPLSALVPAGTQDISRVNNNDLRAIDVIGYKVNPAP